MKMENLEKLVMWLSVQSNPGTENSHYKGLGVIACAWHIQETVRG